jgi:hypothetical protein
MYNAAAYVYMYNAAAYVYMYNAAAYGWSSSCIHTYIHAYIHRYTAAHRWSSSCIHTYIHIHRHASTHRSSRHELFAHSEAQLWVRDHIHTYIRKYMHTCTGTRPRTAPVDMNFLLYTYIHTHIHTTNTGTRPRTAAVDMDFLRTLRRNTGSVILSPEALRRQNTSPIGGNLDLAGSALSMLASTAMAQPLPVRYLYTCKYLCVYTCSPAP